MERALRAIPVPAPKGSTGEARAHAQGLWIRYYTLDGFAPDSHRGYTASYNFGSQTIAAQRWRAAIRAGVDFIATDQHEAFAEMRSNMRLSQ